MTSLRCTRKVKLSLFYMKFWYQARMAELGEVEQIDKEWWDYIIFSFKSTLLMHIDHALIDQAFWFFVCIFCYLILFTARMFFFF